MRTLNIAIFAALVALVGCQENAGRAASNTSDEKTPSLAEKTETQMIAVKGMTCGACESAIRSAVKKIPGVVDCKASHKDEQVSLTFTPGPFEMDSVKKAITDLGYTVQ